MMGGRRRAGALRLPLPFLLLPPVALGLAVSGAVVLALGLALVATVAAVLFSVALTGGVFAVLGFVAWQLLRHTVPGLHGARRGKRGRRRKAGQEIDAPPGLNDTPVDLLRRRYAAGEIGQTVFRRQLTDLLKERYVRGDLTLAEFESRVHHLYQDPALQPPFA